MHNSFNSVQPCLRWIWLCWIILVSIDSMIHYICKSYMKEGLILRSNTKFRKRKRGTQVMTKVFVEINLMTYRDFMPSIWYLKNDFYKSSSVCIFMLLSENGKKVGQLAARVFWIVCLDRLVEEFVSKFSNLKIESCWGLSQITQAMIFFTPTPLSWKGKEVVELRLGFFARTLFLLIPWWNGGWSPDERPRKRVSMYMV